MAILAGLSVVPIAGFAALAIDVASWQMTKSAMQGAADQAALAAALVAGQGNSVAQAEARSVAAANGFVNGSAGAQVSFTSPPARGPAAGVPGAFEVAISQPQPLYLSGLFLPAGPTETARASVQPTSSPTCIMAMGSSGRTMSSSGSGTIDAGSCNIYVNSRSSCAVTLSGGMTVKGYDVYLGQPATSGCNNPPSTITAAHSMNLNSAAATDPYASRAIPSAGSCMTVPNTNQATVTLNPGTYCQNIAFNGVNGGTQRVTFNPGLYVLAGANLNVGGTTEINAQGVSLVFTGGGGGYGSLNTNGSVTFNVTPMTTGPAAGIAMWFDSRGGGRVAFNGSTTLNVTGAIYAPSSQFTWGGNLSSPCTQLIVSSLDFSGSANFRHQCDGIGVSDVAAGGGYKLVE